MNCVYLFALCVINLHDIPFLICNFQQFFSYIFLSHFLVQQQNQNTGVKLLHGSSLKKLVCMHNFQLSVDVDDDDGNEKRGKQVGFGTSSIHQLQLFPKQQCKRDKHEIMLLLSFATRIRPLRTIVNIRDYFSPNTFPTKSLKVFDF